VLPSALICSVHAVAVPPPLTASNSSSEALAPGPVPSVCD
jgi:hypothetical protein